MLIAFWHIATINNWYEIVDEQLGKLIRSGLLDALEHVYVGALGEPDLLRLPPNRFTITYTSPDIQEFEFPTLAAAQQFACAHPEAKLLYFHVKGASRGYEDSTSKYQISFWRRYMEYFTIECWQACVAALEDCDACGVEIRSDPAPHFSGNFWWANATYLATLPPVECCNRADRVAAELWLCHPSRQMHLHSLFQDGRDLYHERILPTSYRGQPPKMPG
jgi:hypothetical protein